MSRLLLRATSGLALLCLLIAPLAVLAHEEIDAGLYVIEYGWVTEPPIAGQANGIELTIAAKPAEVDHEVTGTIKLTSPADGSAVQGDKVEVSIAVEGLDHADEELLHWHLYVDDQNLLMAPIHQSTVTVANLSNGTHTIKVAFAATDHAEIGEPAQASVTVEGSSATGAPKIEGLEEAAHGHDSNDLGLDVSVLKVELIYGSETNVLTLKPVHDEAGKYTADFTPERPGLYTLKISGNLSGALGISPVAAEVNPEEVTPGQTASTTNESGSSNNLAIIVLSGLAVVILGGSVGVYLATRKK